MTGEKRKYPRKLFRPDDHDFSFYLQDKGGSYEISNVQDVSISGVGVGIPRSFNIGQKVSLQYDSEDYHLTIDGTIVWCDGSVNSGSCRLGVEFDADSQEDNTLFLLAVRKYLDTSDNTQLKT